MVEGLSILSIKLKLVVHKLGQIRYKEEVYTFVWTNQITLNTIRLDDKFTKNENSI